MCFWWYIFTITFWGYFVILEGCFVYIFNVLYCLLIYLVVVFEVFRRVFLVGTFCIYFFINIYHILSYLCLYSAILCSKWATVNFHLRQNQKKGKCETDKLSWSQYWSNWRYITFLETFRKEAEIRNDPVNNLLTYYCCAGPRSGYHRRWYQTSPAKVIWRIHWNAKWTTMSKYQSQVNQTNYLEHMTVKNVLFA